MAGGVVRLVFTGDATGLKRAAKETETAIGGVEKVTGGLAGKLAAGFSAVAVGKFALSAVRAASDIEESTNKLTQLLGSSAVEIQDWGKTTAASFGISRSAALESVGIFANLFNGLAKGELETARMSKTFTALSADLASFNNTSVSDATLALQSALSGRVMPLRRYGILLDAATLKQKAYDMGLVKSTVGVLPPAVRMQAAYAAILEQSTKQQGDFARTADSTANQMKTLGARFSDVKVALGEQLTPAAKGAVGAIEGLLPITKQVISAVGGLTTKVPGGAGALTDIGTAALTAYGAFKILASIAPHVEKAFAKALPDPKVFIGPLTRTQTFMSTFAASIAPYAVGLALVGGVAALAASKHAKAQAEIAEDAARLGSKLKDSGDPIYKYISFLDDIKAAQEKNAAATSAAFGSAGSAQQQWLVQLLSTEKVLEEIRKGSISIGTMNSALTAGGQGFVELAESMRSLNTQIGPGSEGILIQGVSEKLRELADASVFTNLPLSALAGQLAGLKDNGVLTTKEFEDLADAIEAAGKAQIKNDTVTKIAIQSKTEQMFALSQTGKAWLQHELDNAKATRELDKYVEIAPQVVEYVNNNRAALGLSTVAVGKNVISLKEQADQLEATAEGTEFATETEKEHEKAVKKDTEALEKQVKAAEKRLEALDKQSEALIRSFDTELALVDANQDVVDSQEDLAEAARETAEDYEKALLKTERALLSAAAAEVENANTLAIAAGGKLTSAEANRIYVSKLEALKESVSDPRLKEYLDRIIASMKTQAEKTNAAAGSGQAYIDYLLKLIALADDPALRRLQVLGGFAEFPQGSTNPTLTQTSPPPPPPPYIAPGIEPMFGREHGGPVGAGRTYMVGEQGPELFTSQQSGTIIPNGALSGVGGVTINVNTPIGKPEDVVRWISQELRRQDRGRR